MNKDNTVRQAGGFIIQLMPFCDEKVIENWSSVWQKSIPLPHSLTRA